MWSVCNTSCLLFFFLPLFLSFHGRQSYKLIQSESFPQDAVLHKLLQYGSLPQGAIFQEQLLQHGLPLSTGQYVLPGVFSSANSHKLQGFFRTDLHALVRDLPWTAEAQLPHHGCHHSPQGSLCTGAFFSFWWSSFIHIFYLLSSRTFHPFLNMLSHARFCQHC